MKTLVIIHPDGTRTEHPVDSDLTLEVSPGDEVIVLDENGEPAEAELNRDGEDLEVKFPDGDEVTLENFYTRAGDNDPVTIALSAQSSVEEYAEFEGRVGNLPNSGGFSLMRLSSTGYTDFGNSIGSIGREISGLANGDNTPGATSGFGGGGAGDSADDSGVQGASAGNNEGQGDRRDSSNSASGFFSAPAATGTDAGTSNSDPISLNRYHVLEEDGATTVSGTVPVLDPDGDGVFATVGEGTHYGEFSVSSGGAYRYTPNHSNPTIQELNVGDTLVDYATIRVTDSRGGEALSVVKFTITGTNDDPIASPAFGTVAEPGSGVDVAFATGKVEGSDIDNGAELSFAATGVPTFGSVNMDAQGHWTYLVNPGNATVQALNVGETLTETITYEVVDEHGATDTETLTITILGTNDAPVAQAETATIAEDAITVGGTLVATDIDNGATLTFDAVTDSPGDNNLGDFTIAGNGTWSFDLDNSNPDVQALAVGDTLTETYSYTVRDEHGATSSETISVTITGTNDDPVATDDSATIDENGAAITISVLPNDSDVDGNPLSVDSIKFTPTIGGTATLVGNEIVFNPGTDFDYVGEGESATETITYTISDGNGGTDTATVTVTITGSNDGPTAVDDIGTVDEDATLTVSAADGVIQGRGEDSDTDANDELTVTGVENSDSIAALVGNPLIGKYGTLTLNEDGSYRYFADQDAADALGAGDTADDVFTYTIGDGNGGNDTAQLTITITGTNDAPIANPDGGTPGVDPGIYDDADSIDEDDIAPATGNVLDNDLDLDATDTLIVSEVNGVNTNVDNLVVGTYGAITINEDGSYSYDLDNGNATVQALGVGETIIETFTYTADDQNGGNATATLSITISGTNDAPIANPIGGTPGVDFGVYDDSDSITEDAFPDSTDGNVLANDLDPDGDTLTVSAVNGSAGNVGSSVTGTYGAIRLNEDGSYNYILNNSNPAIDALDDGESLTETFTYTADDGNGGTATATLTITIDGSDDATVTLEDTVSTDENTPLVIDVLGNDSDPDDTLTIASVNTAGIPGGSVSIAPDGSNITFDPGADFDELAVGETEQVTFTYTTNTGATETVTVTVTGTNDGPTANADIATTDEDTPVLNINVLGNDTDPDGDTLSVISSPSAPNGTVTVNGDGTLNYTPDTDFNGTDIITYTITDPSGATSTSTVTVTVNPVNDTPVAVDDTASTNEDTAVILTLADLVTANDTDLDGDTLSISAVGNATNGTVALNVDGSVTFTPNDDFNGDATFEYTVSDGNGGTDTATVTVTVDPINDNPEADPAAGTVQEDLVPLVSGQLTAADIDGDDLTFASVTDAAGTNGYGDFTIDANGAWSFNLNDNNAAVDALAPGDTITETYTYTVSDGNGGSDTDTITITIQGTNDAPVAVADTGSGDEDTNITGNVLTNDTDVDNVAANLSVIDNSDPTNGTVIVNANGSYIYTPNADFNGTDSFTYTVSDGTGGTATATVTLTVNPANDAPVAVDDSGAAGENGTSTFTVITNDTDLDGDTLDVTAIDITALTGGTATLNADDTITFDPGTDFNYLAAGETATQIITYTVSDGNGGTDTATLTVTVTGSNDGPVAVDDTGIVDENSTLTANALAGVVTNDTDLDTSDILTVTAVRTGAEVGSGTSGILNAPLAGTYGTLTLQANGSYSYVADQAAADALADGVTATDVFTYTISDGNGGTDTAQITLTITGTNDGPVAVDDTGAVNEGATLTVDQANGLIDSNDSDLDGDTLTITAGDGATLGTYGTLTLATDGSYSYVANTAAANALAAGETATDTFSYTIEDGNGGSDTAQLDITVTGSNDGPTAVADSASTDEDNAVLNIDLLGDDTDPDGDTLTLTQIDGIAAGGTITLASGALVTVNGNGTVDYDPNGQFEALDETATATDSFTYTISDGNGGTSTATVTVTINGVDDATVIVADAADTNENTSVIIDVLGNDSDVDDTLAVASVTQPAAGQGSVTNNGSNVTFVPGTEFDDLGAGETETVTFTYTTNTGATETVTVTVTGTNDGPVAVNDTGAVDEDATLTVNAATGVIQGTGADSDADTTDTLTVTNIRTGTEAAGTGTPGLVGGDLVGTYGTLNLAADGSYSYVADQAAADALADGVTAMDVFTYTISDGNGGTDTAQITLTITGTNDGPVAVDDTGAVNEGATLTVDQANGLIDSNDSDLDGDTLTITAGDGTTLGTYGTLVLDPDGSYSYVANTAAANALAAGETATDTYSYTIEDGNGGSDTATLTITVTGTNDGPNAVADTASTNEDSAVLNIDLLGDDTDPDGDTLTLTQINGIAAGGTITLASGALVTVNGNGTVDYDPNGQFEALDETATATDSFTYTISDGNGGTSTATVTVTINGVDDATVIVADAAATDENTSVIIDVLGNDSDVDDKLAVASVTQPAAGQGTVTNNGSNVTFVPGTEFDDLGAGETETVTFTYTTNTGATETVTVTVTGTNDGPVAVDDIGAVNEDATLTVNAANGVIQGAGTDTDLDTTDVLTVTNIRTGTEAAGSGTAGLVGGDLVGTYGTLKLAADGSYSYVADQAAADALADGVTATDVFTYTISDGNGGTDTAQITLTITGTNDGPVAVDDTGAVNEGATLTVDQANGLIDSNDSDLDGDTLTITAGDGATLGTYGTLTLATDGSYSYVANTAAANALAAGETATDTFSYTIEDGNGGSDTAQLDITVTGSNDGPTAVADSASTDEDNAVLNIDLLGDDTDPDGDTLTLTQIDGIAAGGTITLASGALVTVNGNGTVDYDPNGQFEALDETATATDSFTYTISDGNGGTSTATVTVTINGVDDATVIVADAADTNENTSVIIDVLGNDSDVDDTLAVASVTQPAAGQGSVTNNGSNVTFVPGTEFDDLGAGETETVTFTYTTNTGATETVTVTVTGTNDGPVAVNDTGAVDEDATLTVNAATGVIQGTGADSDADTTDTLTVTNIRTGTEAAGTGTPGLVGGDLVGTYGTLNLAADGSYSYVADQAAADALADGVTAMDVFTYTISDGNGGTDTAQITLTITGTNDGPVAVDDTGAVNEGATLTVDQANGLIDSNDSDLDGDTLTITAGDGTTLGTYGTLTLATDGSYSYVANAAAANALAAGETATDTFTYTIGDGNGGSDTAQLVITVTGSNDGPTAVADTAATDEDKAVLNIDLLGDDTDPDGDTLTLTQINGIAAGGTITLASGALVTVNGNGTVDYDPNGQFEALDETATATDSFTYTISDGNGGTSTATVTVTVNGVDDATVIVADAAATDENTSVIIDVLSNDSDVDDTLTVASVTQPAAGQGSVTNNGSNVTFDPGSDFDDLAASETETVTFTYTTNTGATETVTVTVTGTNDGPVAVNDTGAVDEDATLTVTAVNGVVQNNDTDLDTTDVLTVTNIRTGTEAAGTGTPGLVGGDLVGTYGTLNLAADGSYSYVADQAAADALADGVTATDVFTYTISDGNGGTDTAQITITVTGTNDATVVVADAASTDQDTSVVIDVLGNDSDADDTLTVASVSATTGGGTVTNNGANVTFVPGTDFDDLGVGETRTATFTYTTNTGATETVTVTVTGTNDGPAAVDDTASTDQDTATIIDVTGNDTDTDTNDTLTVLSVEQPAMGSVSITGTGVRFDPGSDFDYLDDGETTTVTFGYTVTDGNGGTDTATVTVTVTGADDPLVAVSDFGSTDEDSPVTINVVANDVEPDDADKALTVTALSNPTLGSVTTDGTNVTFDPGSDFDYLTSGESQDVTFTYTVTNQDGATDTETVTITVNGVNDAPDTHEDTLHTIEGVGRAVDVITNDDDAESLQLTVTEINGTAVVPNTPVQLASGATVSLMEDGRVYFNPNGRYADLDFGESATETFTYTVTDADGETATETVTVTIDGTDQEEVISGAYQVISNQLYDIQLDPTDESIIYVPVGDPLPFNFNSIAFNANDNLIYASAKGSDAGLGVTVNDIIQISPLTGQVVGNLGQFLNDQGEAINKFAGVINSDINVYYVNGDPDTSGNRTYAIDLDPSSPTYLSVTGIGNLPGADYGVDPNTGLIWSVNGTTTYSLDPTSGVRTTYNNGGLQSDGVTPVDGAFGSMFSDGNGNIQVTSNEGYGFYRVDTSNGTLIRIADAPATNSNDATGTLNTALPSAQPFLFLDTDGDTNAPSSRDVIRVYDPNGGAVSIADSDTSIADLDGNVISSAEIILKNRQAGDELIIGTLPATVSGSISTQGGYLVVTITGDGSQEDYANAIEAISFQNTGSGAVLTDPREITVTITDENGIVSNPSKSTIFIGEGAGAASARDTQGGDSIVADSLHVHEDDNDVTTGGATLNLLTNDSNNPTTIVGVTQPPANQGTVTNNGAGTVTFNPGNDFQYLSEGQIATTSFTYTTNTGDTETVTMTIHGANDPIAAVADSAIAPADEVTTIDVLANDSDADSIDQPLTISATTQPAKGSVTTDGSQVFFNPGTDFTGLAPGETEVVTFIYTVTNASGQLENELVTVTVTGANADPVAVDDTGAVNEDSTLNVTTANGVIDDNDIDPDAGAVLKVTAIRTGAESATGTAGTVGANLAGAYGTIALAEDGSYTYVADQSVADALAVGVTATDTFTYTVSDGFGGSDTAELTITVTGVNDGPAAVNDTGAVDEDATLTVLKATGVIDDNDTDVDGDTLTVTAIRTGTEAGSGTAGSVATDLTGTYGTLNLAADGSYTYVADQAAADALAVGVTATDTFTYTVSDGNGGTDTAEIVITVTGVNDGPAAVNDTGAVDEDATLTVLKATGVIDDNDTDVDGDTLTVTTIRTGTEAGSGTAGSVATDLTGTYGTLNLAADGSYTYVADQAAADALAVGVTATDTFTYTVSDGNGGTDTAEIVITVTGVNDGPAAVNDTGAVDEDATLTVLKATGVVDDNDTDVDGDTLTVTAIRTGTEAGSGTAGSVATDLTGTYGTLNLAADGSYTYVADQAAADALAVGVTATDTFTYTVSDGNGSTDTAEIVITVTGVNDGPAAVNDTGAVDEDATLTVLKADGVIDNNDSDIDGGTLEVSAIRTGTEAGSGTAGSVATDLTGTYGTLNLAADGSYTYVADQAAADALAIGASAVDTFTYTVSDGVGGTDTAELAITVTGTTNDAPVTTMDATSPLTVNKAFPGINMSFEDDGDFDPSTTPGTGSASWTLTDESNVTGWNTTASDGQFEFWDDGFQGKAAHDGNFFVELNANENSTLWQAVDTSAGNALLIDFQHMQRANTNEEIRLFIGSSPPPDKTSSGQVEDLAALGFTEILTTDSNSTSSWTNYQDVAIIPPGQNTTYVLFQSTNSGSVGNFLDSVNLSQTTLVLLSDLNVAISDIDSPNLQSATITLTNAEAGDVITLSSTLAAGLTSSSVNSGGQIEITIIGDASISDYQAAINSVGFASSSIVAGNRLIEVEVSDGSLSSNVGTTSLTYSGTTPPVVIDLDGDGVEFDSVEGGILLDVDGDGELERTAWADEDDGILVYDGNGNGNIDDASEFSFASYSDLAGATDLEGLRAGFDTDGDGLLSSGDEQFESFKIWQDADDDGLVGEGELNSLTDHGIESIGLINDGERYVAADGDVFVYGESQVNYTDGTIGQAADAAFDYLEIVEDEGADDDLAVVTNDGNTVNLDETSAPSAEEVAPPTAPAPEPVSAPITTPPSSVPVDDDAAAAAAANTGAM